MFKQKYISQKLRELRLQHQLHLSELAKILNTTALDLIDWENGCGLPDTYTLFRLANLYQISMEEILAPGVEINHIVMLVDASNSMENNKQDVIAFAHQLIEKQKKQKEITKFSFVAFNHNVMPIIEARDIHLPIQNLDYETGGFTALYDALGYTIDKLTHPNEHVYLIIITDGMDNFSTKYSKAEIKAKICQLDHWHINLFSTNTTTIELFEKAYCYPIRINNYVKDFIPVLYDVIS